jgi:hypothetical protein
MKKFIVFGVVLALLVPTLAMAATEFSLGGFIKMDMMWDSDSGVGKNMNAPPARNNDFNQKHGRMKFTAQGSRFNLTIKGPDLWGAKTSGFIEMDFDSAERGTLNQGNFSASNNYTPRLRHAMFRFNWPTSELLFGQYWSMFCEYFAESAEDGPLQMTGTPTARNAQVRFTQKFMEDWTVAASISDPNQASLPAQAAGPYVATINNGQSAETPQLQAKVSYAPDFWGKAAYYGKPTPFTVQFVGGWQRNVMRPQALGAQVYGDLQASNAGFAGAAASSVNRNYYVNPWLAMGSMFIPVIPTQSANLAGTASILTQWWIGQGVEAFGFSGVAGNKYSFSPILQQNGFVSQANYEPSLLNKFGGFVQGQYYFNNQWFMNGLYAFSKAYGVNRSVFQSAAANGAWAGFNGANATYFGDGFTSANEAQTIQQFSATLWYRPIQAIKFGLQYSYLAAHYFQQNTNPQTAFAPGTAGSGGANSSNFGDNHRVEFVGFFYF